MKTYLQRANPRPAESLKEVDVIVRQLRDEGKIGSQRVGSSGTVFTYRGGSLQTVEVLFPDDYKLTDAANGD